MLSFLKEKIRLSRNKISSHSKMKSEKKENVAEKYKTICVENVYKMFQIAIYFTKSNWWNCEDIDLKLRQFKGQGGGEMLKKIEENSEKIF